MRKTEIWTCDLDGRDKGRIFKMTEMDSVRASDYVLKAMNLIALSGSRLEDVAAHAKKRDAGVPLGFIRALVDPSIVEWKTCVEYLPPGQLPPQKLFEGEACQIEEAATWWALAVRVFLLHAGFSKPDVNSTSGTPSHLRKRRGSSATPISQTPLAASSPPDSPH